MAGQGKTSKISSIIATLCIFIYIVAIAFGAVQIIENSGQRRSLAEKEFYDLADRASSSAVFLGFMSEAFRETINDFIAGSETLLGAIITGSDGEYAFERSPGSGIVWTGDSPRFKTGIGIPGEPFLLYLRIEGQRNVTIQAIYSPFESAVVLKVLRNTLLAVLAALVITLITLLAELTTKNRAGNYRSKETDDSFDTGDSQDTKTGQFTPDRIIVTKYSKNEAYTPLSKWTKDTKLQSGPALPVQNETDKTPQGLYTPRGNIGWESYTRDRLDSELHRCSSFEQDLVFMVMEFKGTEEINDVLYRQIADEAVSCFALRDMIFEKGGNGLSVISTSLDLDQGISKAEDFRSRIIARLGEKEGKELCIGISSRNGRLIEADRMILESSRALEKALEEPTSPIMAFRSDLEKYREFLKEHPTS